MKYWLLLCLMLLSFQLQAQNQNYQLSIQVTDSEQSTPVSDMTVVLYQFGETSTAWRHIDTKKTDGKGRIDDFLEGLDHDGVYRLVLRSGRYFQQNGISSFYPLIPIVFSVESGKTVHLPVMISGAGYRISRDEKVSVPD